MNAILQAQRERVGRQIRTARQLAGLSHDKLAAAVGTSRQHLIKLEKGQHLAGETMVARIAEATGKPMAFFAADDDEESDPVADLFDALRRTVEAAVDARIAAVTARSDLPLALAAALRRDHSVAA